EELHRQQVEEDLERSPDAVLAATRGSRMMAHLDLGDLRSCLVGERRQETMHLAVEAGLVEDLSPVRLEGAAIVVESHPSDSADEPVGDPRGNAPKEAVLALS